MNRGEAIREAARRMAQTISELPNTSDEEKASLKTDLVNIGVMHRVDAAGVRSAPCSGRHDAAVCSTCGHGMVVHDPQLTCLMCHEVCGYCGQFRDQHTDTEWRSCVADLNRSDHCDGCGERTVVTDVWIDRTPTTLCQPCVLDALTAEGEHLGNYFGWEIE
jgi:hypothetical protein